MYSDCGPFTKNKEKIQKLKEKRDTKYIYKNELDKACFQHGIAYGYLKDLPTISFIIFWDFSIFYQIFHSPQVKRWTIITYKHGIYELPNDLRLRILRN